MNWKTVRLELAATPEFPRGSVARAYLLRIPLNPDGFIDSLAIESQPQRATVRRHWPSEADCYGHVRHGALGLQLCFDAPERCTGSFRLETHGLIESDGLVTITETGGARLLFRVAHIEG